MIEIKAYAKINLTLDIGSRRPNGYHNIESVMQSVSLYDTVSVGRGGLNRIRVSSNASYLPNDERNTAFQAATLFFKHTGLAAQADIRIDKKIPSRSGMGGGSSDAAAVLWGLNELHQTGLSLPELMRLGVRVGADVPFCLAGGTCLCRGIGEKITRVDPMPACTLLICKPPAGISTPRAYGLVDKLPVPAAGATPKMLTALKSGALHNVAAALSNRFDEVTLLSQVQNIKKLLRQNSALNAMMTGSGSAVYGIFEDAGHAKACVPKLRGCGEIFLAQPVNV